MFYHELTKNGTFFLVFGTKTNSIPYYIF